MYCANIDIVELGLRVFWFSMVLFHFVKAAHRGHILHDLPANMFLGSQTYENNLCQNQS